MTTTPAQGAIPADQSGPCARCPDPSECGVCAQCALGRPAATPHPAEPPASQPVSATSEAPKRGEQPWWASRPIDRLDWPADFAGENGCYECRCVSCGASFYGYKRRVLCQVCDRASERAAGFTVSDALRARKELGEKLTLAAEVPQEAAQGQAMPELRPPMRHIAGVSEDLLRRVAIAQTAQPAQAPAECFEAWWYGWEDVRTRASRFLFQRMSMEVAKEIWNAALAQTAQPAQAPSGAVAADRAVGELSDEQISELYRSEFILSSFESAPHRFARAIIAADRALASLPAATAEAAATSVQQGQAQAEEVFRDRGFVALRDDDGWHDGEEMVPEEDEPHLRALVEGWSWVLVDRVFYRAALASQQAAGGVK